MSGSGNAKETQKMIRTSNDQVSQAKFENQQEQAEDTEDEEKQIQAEAQFVVSNAEPNRVN